MRIYKGNPELVFRGRVAPWYGVLSGVVAAAAAVLALQPGMPAVVPAIVLVAAAIFLWPIVVRNRVELYANRLEIVFGWGRTIIPYDHVRDVRRSAGALVPEEFTGHVAAASTDAVFIDAPMDGDAVVSVLGNDHLVTELRRRAGLDAPAPSPATSDPTPASAPRRQR